MTRLQRLSTRIARLQSQFIAAKRAAKGTAEVRVVNVRGHKRRAHWCQGHQKVYLA